MSKRWSEEARKLQSERMKSRMKEWWSRPGERQKQSERKKKYYQEHPEASTKGYKWGEEAKKKHSESKKNWYKEHPESTTKGYKWSEEAKKRHSKKMKEVHTRPEVKKKHREAVKEASNRPEVKESIHKKSKEYWNNSENRKRHSEKIREIWRNLDTRKALCEGRKRHWKKVPSEKRKNHMLHASKAIKFVSKGEAALYELIYQHYPTAKHSQWIAGYQADIILSEFKINVEYDGVYWHRNPEKDRIRDEIFQKLGWTILRVREKVLFDINILHQLVNERKGLIDARFFIRAC